MINKFLFTIFFFSSFEVIYASSYQSNLKDSLYWNVNTKLLPLRLPLPPVGYSPEYIDLDNDGKPDAIKSVTHNNVPILWLDDDGNMQEGDLEGDMANDCLLIDRNKDGIYGGQGDLIIDWVDEDGDGKADTQFVIEYPFKKTTEVWPNGHYMVIRDLDNDNIFNYIDWNTFELKCWDHNGLSDFYVDYSGKTCFMKIHSSTYDMEDLRINWENPFLFYDSDNDGLSEMTIRIMDSPEIRDFKAPMNSYVNRQMRGVCTWAAISVDLDNDNCSGNEFDLDFSIGFQGKGFDYKDQKHEISNLRGKPEADKFFMDSRYRKMTELIYPNHDAAYNLIFSRGEWDRVNFVYDEDDDCSRWERVEFYDPLDPFKVGTKNAGVDNNSQSDACGDRGEWDMDNSGKGKLYLSKFDGRIHLYGAETGVWRIDQNAAYYQGWNRTWMGNKNPDSFATVSYKDRNNNGFFDFIEYDLDGDFKYETSVDLIQLGINDVCDIVDISNFTYNDYNSLCKKMSEQIWNNAKKALLVANQYNIESSWYSKFLNPNSLREKYYNGYWLQFYLFKDLEHIFLREKNIDNLQVLYKAYYSGDWSIVSKKGCAGFYFFSEKQISDIKQAAMTDWGKKIIKSLSKQVSERRTHMMEVPKEEGGHLHHYFCPIHNLMFTFDWDKPFSHYCDACKKEWTGDKRYDWAWIYKVHMYNCDYMYNCMYLYLATENRKYAEYIRDMLLDYAGKYKGWVEHNASRVVTDKHSGKAFAQSLDEASWATKVAMAYCAIKKELTDDEIKRIENGYLRPASDMLLKRPAGANWQMWHNSGLAALGVALEDDSIIKVALDKDIYGYYYLIKKHLNSDGWINEGSPCYHYYPLAALLFTANAVKCRGYNLFNNDLFKMFVEPIKGVYPDLSFPAHNDGWYGTSLVTQSSLYEFADSFYDNNLIDKVLSLSYSYTRRLSPEALLNNKDIKADDKLLIQKSYSFDKSGFCLLRSDKKTVVLKFGASGIGHGHPDKLSITIHDGEKELVSDFGTSGYGTPDYLGWYKRTLSHNTVTVDCKDQKKLDGKLLKFEPYVNGGYAEAEVKGAYNHVYMKRSLKLVGDSISDIFVCKSDTNHLYEYVLIFNEKPRIKGIPKPIRLDCSDVHKRLLNTYSYPYSSDLFIALESLNVKLNVLGGDVIDVVAGESAGIPSNPNNNVGPGSKIKAMQPCYLLIVRVKGSNVEFKADWNIE